MVRRCRFCFVGSDSRVAFYRIFLTLFRTCRDQMLPQIFSSFRFCVGVFGVGFLFKKPLPGFAGVDTVGCMRPKDAIFLYSLRERQ